MYVLTNIEAEVTHKVLENAGPDIENDLPEGERRTLRDLIQKLGTSINNGLPEDQPGVDNTLPGQPPRPDNTVPPGGTAQPKR